MHSNCLNLAHHMDDLVICEHKILRNAIDYGSCLSQLDSKLGDT